MVESLKKNSKVKKCEVWGSLNDWDVLKLVQEYLYICLTTFRNSTIPPFHGFCTNQAYLKEQTISLSCLISDMLIAEVKLCTTSLHRRCTVSIVKADNPPTLTYSVTAACQSKCKTCNIGLEYQKDPKKGIWNLMR